MKTTVRVTFLRVVRAEWTKFYSVRSTWIVLGAVALFAIGYAGVSGYFIHQERDAPPTVAQAVGGAFLAIDVLALAVAVFGVLLITGEYRSGLIRATLAAVPCRVPVLAAKALVLLAAMLPVMAVVCLASLLANQAFVDAGERVTLADPGVLRATLGAAIAPVAFGLIGLGIGAMLRHTAGAICVYLVATLVVPVLLPAALPEAIADDVLPYVPVFAAQAMYHVGESTPFPWLLSAGTGALVLAGWVGLVLAGGVAVLRGRDA